MHARVFHSRTFFLFVSLLFLVCCTPVKVARNIWKPDHLKSNQVYASKGVIKIHMKNGELYILSKYLITTDGDTLLGWGDHYNANRRKISSVADDAGDHFRIPFADLALIETNEITRSSGWKVAAMAITGAATLGFTIYCLSNPKACFGSCPTFYAWDGNRMKLMAEGFSSSILPVFEKSDIDMLCGARARGSDFELMLKNEAIETHVIRYADLLLFPKNPQERVFATEEGKFYSAGYVQSPAVCRGPEGSCLDLVREKDDRDRYSASDPKNLAADEILELEFDTVPQGPVGLVIGSRQALLTTYLFYQALINVGEEGIYLASRIESGDKAMLRRVNRIWDLLGGIEVFIQGPSGKWKKAGEIEEMGPIATDVHLLPLPQLPAGTAKVRLKMTKGLWRVDYIGLAPMLEELQPVRVKPACITAADTLNPEALSCLRDSIRPLVTLPGDTYMLHYRLPELAGEYEIFLQSRGYYLEWMREEWLAGKNPAMAALMFGMPRLYLRLVAHDFKVLEPTMEDAFWNSKYVKK